MKPQHFTKGWHLTSHWYGTTHTPPLCLGCTAVWPSLSSIQPSSASGVRSLAVAMLSSHNHPLTWPLLYFTMARLLDLLELITQYPIHTIVTLFFISFYLHTPIIFLLDFGLCNDQAQKKIKSVARKVRKRKRWCSVSMPQSSKLGDFHLLV